MGITARSCHVKKPEVSLPASVLEQITCSGPANAVMVASKLPEAQRAALAQFCYARRHLRHLGLQIVRTLSQQKLAETFGGAWKVIEKQAQNPEKTLASERYPIGEQPKRAVSVATVDLAPHSRPHCGDVEV